MKRKTRTDKPIGRLLIMDDFLPPPDKLLPAHKTVKVTLALEESTVISFKKLAKKHREKYQRMMREVLKGYITKYGA